MSPFCRHCGSVERLTQRYGITVCELCRMAKIARCLDCQKKPPEVSFSHYRDRRCVGCMKAKSQPKRAPKKRQSQKKIGSPAHLAFIRNHPCLVNLPVCRGVKVHAHHVRAGYHAGLAQIADDRWCVPLCNLHHMEGHTIGWRSFEAKYHLNLSEHAIRLASLSPHLG